MFYNSLKKISIILIAIILVESCASRAFPDEKFVIDPEFLDLFYAFSSEETFSFHNKEGVQKIFKITSIDSSFKNEKGGVISERPYRQLQMNFREIGLDTTELERRNEIYVGKDPESLVSGIAIKFNNFYWGDSIVNKTTDVNINTFSQRIVRIDYIFKTSLLEQKPDDVSEIYVTTSKGIVAFTTFSGVRWVRDSL